MKKLTILFDADDTVENLSDCWIAMLNALWHLRNAGRCSRLGYLPCFPHTDERAGIRRTL